MKRDKRLIILKNSYNTAGSVTFLRNGTKCVARFSFVKRQSGIIVICAQNETTQKIYDSISATVEFDCAEEISPTFYLVSETDVLSGSFDAKSILKNKEMGEKYALATDDKQSEKTVEAQSLDLPRYEKTLPCYDDEEIAGINYYPSNITCIIDDVSEEKEEEKEQKIIALETKSLRNFRIEKETRESEKVSFVSGRRASYYEKAQPKIELLFKKFERYETLEKLLPESKWIKIPYDSSGKFYAVGVVGSKPEYVCYAVSSVYSSSCPPAFEDVGVWVPLNVRKGNDLGFWVIFQGCSDGKVNMQSLELVK